MIDVGDSAPDFTLTDQNGAPFSLSARRGHPVILYFFPKAMTSGCTRETEAFASHRSDFERAGVVVVGISVDPVARQREFAERCHASFPLLSDVDRAVARAYGVLGFLGMAKRVTFFLNPEGQVISVVEGMMPGPHVQAAVERYVPRPAQDSSKSK